MTVRSPIRTLAAPLMALAAAALAASPALATSTRETVITYHATGSAHHGLPSTVTVVDPANVGPDLTTSFTWTDEGDIDTITNPLSVVTDAAYDVARRVTGVIANPGGGVRETTASAYLYDAIGRLETARAQATASTWFDTAVTYTPSGRVASITDPDSDTTGFSYNVRNELQVLTDPMGRQTRSDYLADGALKCVRDGWHTATPRTYQRLSTDIWGSTANWWPAKADPDHDCAGLNSDYRTRIADHSPFGETALLQFPGGSTTGGAYDLAGNVISATSRAAETSTLEYDLSNRLVRKLVPVSTSGAPGRDELYGYDLSGLQVCAAVHAAGSTSGSDTCAAKAGYNHRTTTAYDYAGRVTSEISDNGTTARTVAYQYDAAGNRTRITWPDGFYVTYEYDDLGRQIYAKANGSDILSRQLYEDLTGRLRYIYRGGSGWSNGSAEVSLNMRWEDDAELDRQKLRYRETGATQHYFYYSYNAAGQLSSETRPATWRWSAAGFETVAYDLGTQGSDTEVLDQYTAVGGQAATYDANGNRISYDGLDTLHDAENRLVMATTSVMNVTYRYDAAGRRVKKDFGSGSFADTEFLHAGDMEIAEYDASGTLLRRFIPGMGTDDRIAMIEVGSGCGAGPSSCSETSRAYYITDRIGHVIASFDGGGDLIDTYRYSPYGVHDDGTPQAGQPFRFTGRRLDPETGLYFYRARYYDQQHGRFLETDPVGYADQMNLYGYCRNDPVGCTDPTGAFGLKIFDFGGNQANDDYDNANSARFTESSGGIQGPGGGDGEFLASQAENLATMGAEALANGAANIGIIVATEGAGELVAAGAAAARTGAARTAVTGAARTESRVGSYTNTHESGRVYAGKGSRERSQVSGRRVERQTGDRHTATDFTDAPSDRQAFKDESVRMDAAGGPRSDGNHNQIESPGRRYRDEDGG